MIQIYRDPHYIEKFAIYGERHSGTNFLEETIKKTFELDITHFFGFKHWMGFANPNKITYWNRGILFLGIVRHPYEWLNGFFNMPHHVPRHNRNSFERFLLNEWYSENLQRQEIMQDRNYTTQPNTVRYKNIFELRKLKTIYLSEIMPMIAKNYVLVTYEFFTKYHDKFVQMISDRFSLLRKNDPPKPFFKPNIILNENIKKIIDSNIDWSVESVFGYAPR
jgi:hypothetical protein